MEHLPFFPERASSIAAEVDDLYFSWLGLSGLVLAAVAVVIVVFAVKYRAGSQADRGIPDRAAHERATHWIEIAWMAIPLAIFLAMYVWAAAVYLKHATVPADALPIYVVGKQWMWHVRHPGGRREIDELHVPVGRPVELVMTSQDVIHSFSLPAFRVKQDVLPGRYTTLWFEATRAGEYRLFCTQYCGTAHSRMIGRVVAMEPAAFARWLSGGNQAGTMAARGAARFRQLGCGGCHGPNAAVHAPRLEGLFGKPVPLRGGGTVIADEGYIRDAILLPGKDVRAGYEPTMPTFRGQIGEEDLLDIVEYLKSIGSNAPEEMR
ncbi:MAG: cytochrome c oxidase subunit II [Sulfuricella sp.]|nr:cytochrome c oxidase subunit II [Sulfuricella sp.]